MTRSPALPEGLFALALAAVLDGDYALAAATVARAGEVAPDVREIADLAAVIHGQAGDLNTAVYFGKLATTLPSDPRLAAILPASLPSLARVLCRIDEHPFLDRAGRASAAGDWASRRALVPPASGLPSRRRRCPRPTGDHAAEAGAGAGRGRRPAGGAAPTAGRRRDRHPAGQGADRSRPLRRSAGLSSLGGGASSRRCRDRCGRSDRPAARSGIVARRPGATDPRLGRCFRTERTCRHPAAAVVATGSAPRLIVGLLVAGEATLDRRRRAGAHPDAPRCHPLPDRRLRLRQSGRAGERPVPEGGRALVRHPRRRPADPGCHGRGRADRHPARPCRLHRSTPAAGLRQADGAVPGGVDERALRHRARRHGRPADRRLRRSRSRPAPAATARPWPASISAASPHCRTWRGRTGSADAPEAATNGELLFAADATLADLDPATIACWAEIMHRAARREAAAAQSRLPRAAGGRRADRELRVPSASRTASTSSTRPRPRRCSPMPTSRCCPCPVRRSRASSAR